MDLLELRNIPLVLFSDHFDQTAYIRRMFAQSGVHPWILHQTTQVFTILEYIRSEGAAGFLTEEIAQQEPDLHALSVRQFQPAFITLDWNKDLHFNPAMEEFVRFVKKGLPTV